MAETQTPWRIIDGTTTAWFGAASLVEGAGLVGRLAELSAEVVLDLRPTGVRVRVDTDADARAVSAAASDLGLIADPAALQELSVVIESTGPAAAMPFWQEVFDYAPGADGGLTDPLGRDFSLRIQQLGESRPLRNRIHLDVVRPAAAVQKADVGEASGPYGVRHVDADGNEVDLVPGDGLGETPETADWQTVFSAMACYRTTSAAQQRDLVASAASLADAAGFPLIIDLRPGLVIFDSGKDQSDADAHGLDLEFSTLARDLQSAARGLGAVADPELPRLAQLVLDAADMATVRAFWIAALGYTEDRRSGVSDIYDPRRLNPVLVFQELDTSDLERRRQRNRISVELGVPRDLAPLRVASAVAAGGRILEESPDRWRVADPEGNELVVVGSA